MINTQSLLNTPKVSLVIPTHNRSKQLRKVLFALVQQTIPPEDFEVVVVADGCTDNTSEIVESFHEILNICFIEQQSHGPAMARNVGSQEARGNLLVFMDDDIEPLPKFLTAHIRAHSGKERAVVIGYLPPMLENQSGYFRTELRDWWEITFQNMRQPGHRFSYSDLVSGNFSIQAKLFNEISGFNPVYRCHEDYELGIRLLQAGVEFVHSIEAIGYHYERSDLNRALKRKYDEGIADVKLGKQYPFLRSTLLMDKLQNNSLPPSHILKIFAIYWPAIGDLFAHFLRKQMEIIERIRWYKLWRRVLYGLMGYWYWRGVSTELPNLAKVKDFLSNPDAQREARSVCHINLAEGIAKSELILDECRPDIVRLSINQTELGWIPYQPGSEQIRGGHLRPYLVNNLIYELVKAHAKEPNFPYPEVSTALVAQCEESLKHKKSVQKTIQ